MTHQVNIKAPFGETVIGMMNRKYIRKFNLCWIPDREEEPNLSGELGHSYRTAQHTRYIGNLSRLKKGVSDNKDTDILMLLSGPEPQRTIFESLLLKEAEKIVKIDPKLKLVMLRGKPGGSSWIKDQGLKIKGQGSRVKDQGSKIKGQGARVNDDRILVLDHASETDLQDLIERSKLVVARSGYSTIMDLNRVGGKAAFVPTPGQPEQEYLAQRLMDKGQALMMKQGKIDLVYALESSKNYSGFPGEKESSALDNALDELGRLLQGKSKN